MRSSVRTQGGPPASRRAPEPWKADGTTRAADEASAVDDQELGRLVAEDDLRAFESVYDRHAGAAFSLALSIVRDRTLAEEATQEAFLSVWRSRHAYRADRGSLRTWVLGITRNRAIDAVRRTSTHARRCAAEEILERQVVVPMGVHSDVTHLEDARELRSALRALPAEQRNAIQLAFFSGLTHAEIAAELEIPLGTVKGRMRLGLDKLGCELRETHGPGTA